MIESHSKQPAGPAVIRIVTRLTDQWHYYYHYYLSCSYFIRRFSCRIARLRSSPAIRQPPLVWWIIIILLPHRQPLLVPIAASLLAEGCEPPIHTHSITHSLTHFLSPKSPTPFEFPNHLIHAIPNFRGTQSTTQISPNLPNRSSLARIGDEASLPLTVVHSPPFHYGRSNPVVAAADRPVPTRG